MSPFITHFVAVLAGFSIGVIFSLKVILQRIQNLVQSILSDDVEVKDIEKLIKRLEDVAKK